MSDAQLREAERRWRESGSAQDEAAYLVARLRAGDLSLDRIRLAAYLGDPAARLALPNWAPDLETHAASGGVVEIRDDLQALERALAADRAVAMVDMRWSGPSRMYRERFLERARLLRALAPQTSLEVYCLVPVDDAPNPALTALERWLAPSFPRYGTPLTTGAGEHLWVRRGTLQAHAHGHMQELEFIRRTVSALDLGLD